MSKYTRLSILAVATATLIASASAQASPIFFTDPTAFYSALGGETLSVEDFETLTRNTPSGRGSAGV